MIDRVNRLLGEGTYGKVVECIDRQRDRSVAVKIIRSIQKYRDAARIEIRVLDHLNYHDPRGQK
jgi:dual-specificity kinase